LILPSYPEHEEFVASARGTDQLWRLAIGLCIAAGVYLLCNQIYYSTILTLSGHSNTLWSALVTGSTPLAMYVLLISFGFMMVGVGVAIRVAHSRSPRDVFGPLGKMIGQFVGVLWVLVPLTVVIWVLPPWDLGAPFQANVGLGLWLALLPFSLFAILVQVSAEEVVFRGYLQRQLAARFHSPLIWMLIPSVLFGIGHYLPEEAGENALIIALWAVIFGLLMADLTARSGTLGPAIAVHLVNNVSAMLIVSMPDELSGLALYLSPFSMADEAELRAWLPVDFAWMLVSWLAARLALRR
jgi:membrane protease YdiL (CAAX protease family)